MLAVGKCDAVEIIVEKQGFGKYYTYAPRKN
jgi:hypothetical protein